MVNQRKALAGTRQRLALVQLAVRPYGLPATGFGLRASPPGVVTHFDYGIAGAAVGCFNLKHGIASCLGPQAPQRSWPPPSRSVLREGAKGCRNLELTYWLQLLKQHGPLVGLFIAFIIWQSRKIDQLLERNSKIYDGEIARLAHVQDVLLTKLLGLQP